MNLNPHFGSTPSDPLEDELSMFQRRPISSRIVPALVVLAFGLTFALQPAQAKGRGKGLEKAHELEFEDINPRSATHSEKLSLSDLYAGEGVVLQFVASWCKFCREEMPALQEYQAKSRTPMVFVAADDGVRNDNILIIAERAELTAPLLFVPAEQAEKVSGHYPYEILPATYFIDAKGRIRGFHQGSMTVDRLSREVDALLQVGD